MRHLWKIEDWSFYIPEGCRKGIRLRFDKDVDDEVKRACKEFVSWLRTQYEFPIRVPIYFKAKKHIKSLDGENASATFFGPFDINLEPYIRVSVGDYYDMLEKRGKDEALAAILGSMVHELSHYFQWLKDHENWVKNEGDYDKKSERQARYYSNEIIYDYAETRDHP